jgi:SAM-dependent methyltransferase
VGEVDAESYGAFAYAYDSALGIPFFAVLRPHLERLLQRYEPAGRHLDLACGTGKALHFFSERGFRSTGVDVSMPMLQLSRSAEVASNVHVVAGDVRTLPFRGTFDLLTSFYDSLNHLLTKDDLLDGFRAARRLMHPRSLFWFDMNHPRAYTEVWSIEEPFVSEGEDYRLQIETWFDRNSKLATGEVTGWRQLGDERIEINETHLQRSYSEREVRTLLRQAGLRVVEMFGFNPFDEGSRTLMKMFFVVAPE